MATSKTLGPMPMEFFFPMVEQYFTQLSFYLTATDKEKVSKAVLLSSCGQKAFQLIETLVAPTEVTDATITYEFIKKSVIDHLRPKSILHFERHPLHSMVQKDGESASNFVECLKKQAGRCNFGSLRDDLLLSQFIFGLRSQPIRAKLLADPSLDLTKALQEALLHETVTCATASEAIVGTVNDYSAGVRKVSGKQKKSFPMSKSSSKVTFSLAKGTCYSCAGKHLRKDCKFRTAQCRKCFRTGHIERACQSNSNNGNTKDNRLHHVELDSRSIEPVVLALKSNNSNLWVETCIIGNVSIKFTIDTGSEVTIIPEDIAAILDFEISSTDKIVRAYGGQKIRILGCLDNATIKLRGKVAHGSILVAETGQRSILGMDFIRKFGLVSESSFCAPVTTDVNSQFLASFRLKKDVSIDGMKCSPRSLATRRAQNTTLSWTPASR